MTTEQRANKMGGDLSVSHDIILTAEGICEEGDSGLTAATPVVVIGERSSSKPGQYGPSKAAEFWEDPKCKN